WLKSKKMINLDSEETNNICVGCAGGARITIEVPIEYEELKNQAVMEIMIKGLRGGHSGADIHLQRSNAIKELNRAIGAIREKAKVRIIEINGGNKDNAIPREATVVISVDKKDKERVKEIIIKEFEEIIEDNKEVEGEMKIGINEVKKDKAMNEKSTDNIIDLINVLQHGVIRNSNTIKGLVETSQCLAVVETKEKEVMIKVTPRSSRASVMKQTIRNIKSACRMIDSKIEVSNEYPGWEPNKETELLKEFTKINKEVTGEEPRITAIHAGLECGIIGEKHEGMEMISVGPLIENAHTPEERVNIRTVEEFWKVLKKFLERRDS
ncbi:cytosol nonspecific dipeptidase, partial [Candidatus Pacearchaeota archaeon CG10_big_fil_rev_8_21_14_0_10_35_13]